MSLVDWWLLASLVLGAIWAVGAIVRDIRHYKECGYCRAAKTAARQLHPDWDVWTVRTWSHRATEPDRVLIAVFYREPKRTADSPHYLLFATSHDYSRCELVPDEWP
jgi:hypothetical protein